MTGLFLTWLCLMPLTVEPPSAAGAEPVKAVTAPSEDHTVAGPASSGVVATVLVAEGDRVTAGQPVIQMDDAVLRQQVETLKAQAENTTRIKMSELRLARARSVLEKVQKAHQQDASPARELEEAQMDAALAELTVELDRFEHRQDQAELQEAQLRLERLRLASPVAGKVEKVLVKPGQSVDALAQMLRIVRTDPLWIDVPVPVVQARRLALGGPAAVCLVDDDRTVAGRIVKIASVADSGSQTLEVRVELPNPAGRPAGEHVTVTFPDAPATQPSSPTGAGARAGG